MYRTGRRGPGRCQQELCWCVDLQSWREVDDGQVIGTYRLCRKGNEIFFSESVERLLKVFKLRHVFTSFILKKMI